MDVHLALNGAAMLATSGIAVYALRKGRYMEAYFWLGFFGIVVFETK